MKFLLFLFGFCKLEIDAAHAAALLNLCLQNNCTLTDFEAKEDGAVCFRVGAIPAMRLLRDCKRENLPVRVSRGGFPRRLLSVSRRMGLIFGLLAGIFLLVISGKFVWSIRVSGNQTITAGQVRRTLAEQGLEVGSYLPSLNLSRIETDTLLAEQGLSWIAIHLNGTVAEVQVLERSPVPTVNRQPANLVAVMDGQIEQLELYRGKAMVEVGQPVRAGDLLVSGVYDSQTVGYRYTRAAGAVLARTERTIRVEIPLTDTEKVYQKSVPGEILLRFFNFSFNFFKNSRNEDAFCDIIEVTTGKDWLGLHDLPVSVSQKRYCFYTEIPKARTLEQALELAYEELEDRLSALSPDIRLLEKRIQTQIGEETLVLECRLTCVENIAVQQDFEVSED